MEQFITMKNKHISLFLCLFALAVPEVFAQAVLNPIPAKIFGQFSAPRTVQELASPTSVSPNLVEGRELYVPQGIALDKSVDPPILYVADTGNHRVLAWKNAAAFENGASADLVLGQKDFYSTVPLGPGTTFTSGLYGPTSVAVDGNGNVLVADSGNNRILRYPAPFARPAGQSQTADLVLGQASLNARFANRASTANGTASPTPFTIRTNGSTTGGIQAATLAFDAQGNLWFSDSGNHRILRYAAADVSGASNTGAGGADIAANLVLGQPDLHTAVPNAGRLTPAATQFQDRTNKHAIRFGGPLAFDASGNLFFADDLARVLVWSPPFETGKPASRILGIYLQKPGDAVPPAVNEFTFGFSYSGSTFSGGPQGLFCAGDYLFVSDTIHNRIVRFNPVSTWAPEDLTNYFYSPKMSAIFGQVDFNSREPNGGSTLEPTNYTINGPLAAAVWNGHVFLADSRNNRVLDLGYASDENLLAPATRVLGQYDFPYRAPNLIEGRELSAGSLPLLLPNGSLTSLTLGPAAVIDRTSEPPHLYVADTGNNRILGFYDARRVKYGDTADLIIGQVSPTRSLVNSPGNDASKSTSTGLFLPASVAVDTEGNVWVADTGNARVLRFPRPYDRWGETQTADLVVGQPDFETRTSSEIRRDRLYRPSGIAFTGDGNLVVSDLALNRVLMFSAPLATGASASLVLGQPEGATATGGNGEAQMNLPLGVAVDTDDRLYVADTGNNRVLIFGRVTVQADGAAAALILPLNAQNATPATVTVSARTGQIWVADIRGSRVMRFPRFDQLFFDPGQKAEYAFSTYIPRQIVLDEQDYIYVLDSANRITMHYPLHSVLNGASGFPRVAPAMLALLQAPGVRFGDRTEAAGTPWPKELADVELLVDGVAAPLTRVDGDTLRFVVPKDAATGGTAEFLVRRISTGQILAQNRIGMSAASPAVIYQGDNPAAQAQARAYNQDGSLNTSGKPASSNQELTVYLTGQGSIPGLPEDGSAPGSEVPVADVRAFVLAGTSAAEAQVLSSTLDPAEPGVWKVKVKLPQVLVNGTYGFAVIYRTSFSSNSYTSGSTVLRVNPLVSINK